MIRAYPGASEPCRDTDDFTGFAENDDMPMHDLDPR